MQLKYAELFAGLGIGSLAIESIFPDATCSFYSEIEKNRCDLLKRKHPKSHNIGDIDYVNTDELNEFNLLIGGSPCKDLSIARSNREGLDGFHSGLFYKYLEILQEKKPKFFILENVASMPKDDRDEITRCLGKYNYSNSGQPVRSMEINSLYFTGQIRRRIYWTNFPILPLPTITIDPRHCIDKSVIPTRPTSDFIDVNELYSAYTVNGKMKNPKSLVRGKSDWDFVAWSRSTRYKSFVFGHEYLDWRLANQELKHKCKVLPDGTHEISYVEQRIKINLQANTLLTGPGCSIFSSRNYIRHGDKMRPLTPLECARLQGIPDDHMKGWSDRAVEKAVGDAFTLPVIVHVMESLKAHMNMN